MHTKHPKIQQNKLGAFGRYEVRIYGSPCDQIKNFALKAAAAFHHDFSTAYVDYDHDYLDPPFPNTSRPEVFDLSLNDQDTTWQIQKTKEHLDFDHRLASKHIDLAFINANHPWPKPTESSLNLLLFSNKKWARLKEKNKGFDSIDLVVFLDQKPVDFHDFVPEGTPEFDVQSEGAWFSFLSSKIRPAELHALILSGGKSQRMGQDKGQLNYHGVDQRHHLDALLKNHCVEVHHSVLDASEFPDLNCIEDRFLELGPFGAISSAFLHNPNVAYLVVAVDLPFLDERLIEELINERSPKHIATAIHNPETNWPDPLCTIWEPKSYFSLMDFLALGYSCPRKVLINSNTKVYSSEYVDQLTNANTKEEFLKIKALLDQEVKD